MNQLDFDRAFPPTPVDVQAAIELGLRKGKKKMKFRNKLIAAGSIAAMFAVVIAAAFAMIPQQGETPDLLAQPPLNASALAGPETAGMLAQPEQETYIVFATENGNYYHLDEHCSGMENAVSMTEPEAMQLSKKPCPVCIPLTCPGHENEIEFIYYSQGGKYFHRQEECSGGKMPLKGEYASVLAEYPGKEPCPLCFPNDIWMCLHGKIIAMVSTPNLVAEEAETETHFESAGDPMPESEKSAPALAKDEAAQSAADTVYTEYGANLATYHRLQNCGGQDYRREISVLQANREKLQPCEACYFGYVVYNQNGTYYHSDKNCQGMMNAKQHSREDARREGKFPCLICLNVYCTEGGRYYHLLPDCIGMMSAKLRTLEEAYALNKTRCPVCLSPETVYCTQKGNYFHAVQDCSGMVGAQPTDPESAWNMDKDPCPVCITAINVPLAGQAEN